MSDTRWLLPDGVAELLPPEAESVEALRRRLLDVYSAWGYELVQPPLIEYLESLLTGTGQDLDIQTFKLIDQLNGRMMGVRADMTPQVARIEAHRLRRDVPTRLCYCGTVLHARCEAFGESRNPMQIGVELYGHAGPGSDIEVIELMLESLKLADLPQLYLDLGHIGIYRGLAAQAGLNTAQQARLFDMLQRKSVPEVDAYLTALSLDKKYATMLRNLIDLHGSAEILETAQQALCYADPSVFAALDYLRKVGEAVQRKQPQVQLHYDLAEFRAYHYQTGMVFAAYLDGHGQEIARGGRYDDIGAVFGRACPATGFSTDLNALAPFYLRSQKLPLAIFAPAIDDPQLDIKIAELRAAGRRVVQALPGQSGDARAMRCEYELVWQNKAWQVLESKR